MPAMRLIAASIILTLALVGCGTASLTVIDPVVGDPSFSSIRLADGGSTVDVPPSTEALFVKVLGNALYKKGVFEEGGDLTLSYRFIQVDEGNQFERWFWGGIGNAGEGSLTVEVTYLSGAGMTLGRVEAEGRIGSGFFGGPIREAVDKAARKVAGYTIAEFK